MIGRSQQIVALFGRPLHFDSEFVVVSSRTIAKTRNDLGASRLVGDYNRVDPIKGLRKTKRPSANWIGFRQASVPKRKVFKPPL